MFVFFGVLHDWSALYLDFMKAIHNWSVLHLFVCLFVYNYGLIGQLNVLEFLDFFAQLANITIVVLKKWFNN